MFKKAVYILKSQLMVATMTVAVTASGVLFGGVKNAEAKIIMAEDIPTRIIQLTDKVSELQERLANILAKASTTPQIHSSSSITIGTNITIMNPVRVRSLAGVVAPLLGVQATGSVGTIIAGPMRLGDQNWFQVDFSTGVDGWVTGAVLFKRTDIGNILPPRSRTGSSTVDRTQNVEQGLKAQLDSLNAKYASTSEPLVKSEIEAMIAKLMGELSSTTFMGKSKLPIFKDGLFKPKSSTTTELRPKPKASSTIDKVLKKEQRNSSSTGEVLGASTDMFEQIKVTLSQISNLLGGVSIKSADNIKSPTTTK